MLRVIQTGVACLGVAAQLGCSSQVSSSAPNGNNRQLVGTTAGGGGTEISVDAAGASASGVATQTSTSAGGATSVDDAQPVGATGFDLNASDEAVVDTPAEACAAERSQAMLQQVYLAFGFDVSGSMGKGDEEYHDATLKWEPVVAATKAFFGDARSAGVSASLTFFPIDADEEERCDATNYAQPDVPMTLLPSTDFAAAIDAITPQSEDDWRGGTPTLAVLTGMFDYVSPLAAADPESKYAMVLVTDGYPQSCDDVADSIDTVVSAVSTMAAQVPVYVVGVANPPGGPDTVTNLQDIAVAGGTNDAFLIETGDPAATTNSLRTVIDGIRAQSISCDLTIPPAPAGEKFDAELVNVTYSSGASVAELGYDPSCDATNAWRYDDPALPTQIVLCPSSCSTIQSDAEAVLEVEFGCTRRDVILQ